jgi:hypothetical protein
MTHRFYVGDNAAVFDVLKGTGGALGWVKVPNHHILILI